MSERNETVDALVCIVLIIMLLAYLRVMAALHDAATKPLHIVWSLEGGEEDAGTGDAES